MKTLFIGIGPARCMTTWFVRQLEQSGEVFVPGRKEVKLLADHSFNVDRYMNIMLKSSKKSSLDYSNDYSLKINLVRENIKKLKQATNINVKYIFLFRDPIRRFLSHIELWSTMYNLNYSELPVAIKNDCYKQSIYSNMLKEIELNKTLIINMDKVVKNKNSFDNLIKDFFMVQNFNSKFDKNIGATKTSRSYLFEYVKQKIFQNLEKKDLDIVIKFLRLSRIVDIYNFLTKKQMTQSRNEIQKYYQVIIDEILIDYKNFNNELNARDKNEKTMRFI